jgi:hypothetical protein
MKFRPAKKSFEIDDLPASRREQYLDFFKTRAGLFFAFGGLFLFSCLPLLAAILFKYYVLLLPASKSLGEEEYLSFYKTTSLLFNAIYCLCYLFLFIVFAGAGRVSKQWAQGKGIYFWHDFLLGIKKNIGPYLLLWLLFSIFYLLCKLVALLASKLWVSYLVSGLCLLLLPWLMMAMVETLYYSNNAVKLLSSSFSYCLKKPLSTLAFLLLPYGLLCISLIDQVMIMVLVIVLSVFLLLPLYFLGWHLYALSLFDEFTNKEFYPSIYQKGLRGEFKKEEER